MATVRRSRSSLREACVWTAATVVAVAHFGSFPFLEHPVSTDVRNFLYYSARIARGGIPHVDFFENKPPLAFYAGAALLRAGEAFGADPLLAVRVGYLALAGLGGLMVVALHRRLSGGSDVAGLLALAVYCGFPLMGVLPCIGNVPKLLMALGATAAALLAFRERWLLAGIAGALAAQDWQIGGLVIVGTALAALRSPDPRRALRRSLAGAGLALLPLIAYFAWRGGLAALFEQTILSSVFRGVSSAQSRGVIADWPRRFQLLVSSPFSQAWLIWLGIPGMLLYLRVLLRRDAPPALLLLGTYHFGVAAYSLLDFQAFGDLFILQHTVAFFAAVALWSAYVFAARGVERHLRSGLGRAAAPLAALIVMVLVVRPWVSRHHWRLVPRPPGAALTLTAQRALAGRFTEPLASGRAVVLGPAELLFLTGTANPAPIVYWNAATWGYYRTSALEPEAQTITRLMAATGAEIAICDLEIPAGPAGPCLKAFGRYRTEMGADGYGVNVYSLPRSRASRTP